MLAPIPGFTVCAPQWTRAPSKLQPTKTRIQSTSGFYSNLFFFFYQDLTLGLSLKRGNEKKEASEQGPIDHCVYVRAVTTEDFGIV